MDLRRLGRMPHLLATPHLLPPLFHDDAFEPEFLHRDADEVRGGRGNTELTLTSHLEDLVRRVVEALTRLGPAPGCQVVEHLHKPIPSRPGDVWNEHPSTETREDHLLFDRGHLSTPRRSRFRRAARRSPSHRR